MVKGKKVGDRNDFEGCLKEKNQGLCLVRQLTRRGEGVRGKWYIHETSTDAPYSSSFVQTKYLSSMEILS